VPVGHQPPPVDMSEILSPQDLAFSRPAVAQLDEIQLLVGLIDPDTVVGGLMVDVGAHRGGSLAPFWNAGWTVVAFEPDPRHYQELSTAIQGVDRIILDGRAVSSVSGERVTFYMSEESPGISGLSAFRDSHVAVGTVETVALRDVLDDEHVHLLKVDTEGYDLFVLQGYPFERSRPGVIMAEFEDYKTVPLGYRFADLAGLLVEQGYQVWVSEWHPIIRYGISHQWRRLFRYGRREPDPDGWGNVIALKDPIDDATMLSALSGVVRVRDPLLRDP